ncbi:MAG TPA: DUF416 family protein [Stenotrophomonas sp.]|jgi:uncharacterized protein YjaG (DUF416 family)
MPVIEEFNETSLLLRATGMPGWMRIAFMVYCCERMLPHYRYFSDEAGFGDRGALRGALDDAWTWIESGTLRGCISTLVLACEKQAPDTGNFSSIYTSAALDAATATAITVGATSDPTVAHLIDVASLARDTVDLFVQKSEDIEPNESHFEERILASPLMQAELRIQKESLEFLNGLHDKRETVARQLRVQWSNLARGSLKP